MKRFCIFLVLNFWFVSSLGCASQIKIQAQSLSVTVPAIMTADQGIQEVYEQQPEPLPTWLNTCLRHRLGDPGLVADKYPSLDLQSMEMRENRFHYTVTGYYGQDRPFMQEIYDANFVGRVVGRVEIQNPNAATLEFMHKMSRMFVEAQKDFPHKPDESLPRLFWTRDAHSSMWVSSLVIFLHTYTKKSNLIEIYLPYAPYDAKKEKEIFTNTPHALLQLNAEYEYQINETGLSRLGRQLFMPEYKGILRFKPEYVELIIPADGVNWVSYCFPVN